MVLDVGLVAVACGRVTSLVFDIVLLAFLFTLTESFSQGNGQSISAAFVGLVTDLYDLITIFDLTGKVSQTPMVSVGDFIAEVIAIISVAQLSILDHPPAGAPWESDWYKSFGLLIVFILLHAFLGLGRAYMAFMGWRAMKKGGDKNDIALGTTGAVEQESEP